MTDDQNSRSDDEPGDGRLLTEQAPATITAPRPRRRRWRSRLGSIVVAFALVLGAAGLTLAVEEQRSRDQQSLLTAEQDRLARIEAVLTAEDALTRGTTTGGIRLSAVFSADHHAAVVTYDGLPDIPEKKTFQLWRVRDDKTKSMRILAPDARSGTALILNLADGDSIAFTVESEGGAGQPTGDVVVGLALS